MGGPLGDELRESLTVLALLLSPPPEPQPARMTAATVKRQAILFFSTFTL